MHRTTKWIPAFARMTRSAVIPDPHGGSDPESILTSLYPRRRFGNRIALRFVVIDPELRPGVCNHPRKLVHRRGALLAVVVERRHAPLAPVLLKVDRVAGEDHGAAC